MSDAGQNFCRAGRGAIELRSPPDVSDALAQDRKALNAWRLVRIEERYQKPSGSEADQEAVQRPQKPEMVWPS